MTTFDIANIINSLTLEEKAELCSGQDFWRLPNIERFNLPSIMLTDGPHGLRKQPGDSDHVGLNQSIPATCFPTASALAASWNTELVHKVGVALGEECVAEQVSVLLGPGVNIKRHPLGGRNFEYFSEDPYLSGKLASAWIGGVQSQGVGTSIKHFAANNHEAGRLVVDAILDERTLREIYLPSFETAVTEQQPWTVMCAYNKLNGQYLSEHRYLLTNILQNEWGFTGAVVSDWGAVNDRVLGLKNGLHIEMPSSGRLNTDKIIAAVEAGELSEEILNQSVQRILELIVKAQPALHQAAPTDLEQHHTLAMQAAAEGAVLLQNQDSFLPLKKQAPVLVLGALAADTRYQGAGSSQINPWTLQQPLDEIRHLIGEENVSFEPGYTLKGGVDSDLIEAAIHAAKTAETVILFVGLTPEYESEGFDRKHLELPSQQVALIEAMAELGYKTALVLQNGSPIVIPQHTRFRAILEAYLGGQAGASALAGILFGDINPSGKLAETFPSSLKDQPNQAWFPGSTRQSQYRESIWVGYRYYNTVAQPVLFPFGHGLSYTEFAYNNLSLQASTATADGFRMEPEDVITVRLDVSNVGEVDGAEVVQCYVGQKNASLPRPKKELKAFTKVHLSPGETQTVELKLDYRSFAFWCSRRQQWTVETDQFFIYVGASVADIRLETSIQLTTNTPLGERDDRLHCYFNPHPAHFDDASFSALLNKAIPAAMSTKPFHLNSTVAEIRHHWLGKRIANGVDKAMKDMMGDDTPETMARMAEAIASEMPLRNLIAMSNGQITEKRMTQFIHVMNGDWIKLLTGKSVPKR